MQRVLVRADSSSTIGTGHIMRDLVLCEQFDDAKIFFVTQDLPGNINNKIDKDKYEIILLNSNDSDELISIIKKIKADFLIIDHYDIDYKFEKKIKYSTKIIIMSLDDTYEKHYCDILLNHNISADASKYIGLVPGHCEIRCGSEYTLLREEFLSEKKLGRRNTKSSRKKIFMAMGGADHSNINISLLEVIYDLNLFDVLVFTTHANKNLEALLKFAKTKDCITVFINSENVAMHMNSADFAVVTPSVTVNEVSYLNLPLIAIKTAENQDDMYNYLLNKKELAIDGFDSEKFKKALLDMAGKLV